MTTTFLKPRPAALALALAIALIGGNARAASEAAVLGMLRSPTAGDATLARLMGSWRGGGRVRLAAENAEEATQCRFTNNWAAGQRLAHLLLACRGTEVKFTADGYIGRDGNTYRGAWSLTTGETAVMTGRRSGSGLVLTVTSTGPTRRPPSSLSLRISGNSMTARLTARDARTGKSYTAFETALRK